MLLTQNLLENAIQLNLYLAFFFKLMEITEEDAPKCTITGKLARDVERKKLTINDLNQKKVHLR